MKKHVALAGILVFLFISSPSQKLIHGAGATISNMLKKASVNVSAVDVLFTQLNYTPRYNFIESENSSFSVSAPVGAGIGLASSTYGGDAGLGFSYSGRLVFDYNFGCHSTLENDKNFGGYFGLGFGYQHVRISKTQYLNFNGNSYGPLARLGIRFSKDNFNGKAININFYLKPGMEKEKYLTFGSDVIVEF